MYRRLFFKNIFLLGASIGLPAQLVYAQRQPTGKLLQISPVAGFQYHQGEQVWNQLTKGAVLALVREPDNKYDQRAVRIDFQGQKLGYLPRLDNAAVSQLIDRGEQIQACITDLKVSDDPWQRVEVELRWLL